MKPRRSLKFAAGVLLLMLALNITPALAARDRTPPTQPTNFRVTNVTAYSVSFAWNASFDNSGQFSYVICCAYNNTATVSQFTTAYTFTTGLEAGRTFTFQIVAKDAAGNFSRPSTPVTVTLPPDRQPPSKPVVTVTEVGSTHVALQLSSTENGPYVWYTIYRDGTPIILDSRNASPVISPLQAATSYIFTVRAKDFAGQQSPMSDPVTVTTAPADGSDTTPPTMPSNLSGDASSQDGETSLSWGQSNDNVTPQSLIQYEIYVNGVLDHILVGRGRTVVYGQVGMTNVFEVIAVDAAGNRSATAALSINIP